MLFFQALGPETFMATYLAAGAMSSLTAAFCLIMLNQSQA
jgi:hypothetical protein